MSEFYQIPLEDRKDRDYLKWEKLNFILRRIFDTLENVTGARGPVTFSDDLDLSGKKIAGGPANQLKAGDAEFITKNYLRSAEAGKLIVQLLQSGGKTPLPLQGSVGTPAGGGGGGGVTDHSLLTSLDFASAGHTGFVPSVRTLTTTAPITGGGDLSADRTLAMAKATAAVDGYLAAVDFATFSAKVGGSGTIGKLPKWASTSTLADSVVTEDAGKIGIGTAAPGYKLEVAGSIKATGGGILPAAQTLAFVNPIVGDAATGNHFRVTLTAGGYVLGPFSNLVDGQRIIIELIQDGTGGRTFTLASQFLLGSDSPPIVASGDANKRDVLGAYYVTSLSKLLVTGFLRGF